LYDVTEKCASLW